MKISLCLIAKNEEATLERCLSSVCDLVDEIIIVDTGSTDKTKEVAEQFTEYVIDFQWIDDFAAAQNFAFSHASMDYIMWMDADDVLIAKDHQKLKQLKQSLDPSIDAVYMDYHCDFDEHGNVTLNVLRITFEWRECIIWADSSAPGPGNGTPFDPFNSLQDAIDAATNSPLQLLLV